MTKKNKLYIFIFFIAFLLFLLLILHNIPCLFKTFLHIPCPGCGMTRAFKEILKFNFKKAMYYNILSIPLLLFSIFCAFLFIKDIIKKENKSFDIISNLFSKYYIVLFILLFISWILNIIHGI